MTVRQADKKQIARERVLDAAERLLRADSSGVFTMRDLAADAAVSFATPFNQFGSKIAIMHALSKRRIDDMVGRLRDSELTAAIHVRVPAAASIAVDVLLEEPEVNRALIGSLGAPSKHPGAVSDHSRMLWALALGEYRGVEPALRTAARAVLPEQLALVFRGCLSFWAAGEIADDALAAKAGMGVRAAVLAFADEHSRRALLGHFPDR